MSTLKTTNLQNASASSPAFVLAADGSATANLSSVNDGPIAGSRNRIINGDMRIDQRNAGASVTPANGAYTLDRLQTQSSQASKFSVQQSTVAPVGFTNSALVTSLSAYSVISSDFFYLMHPIEALNTSDLSFGTADAKTVTLSFWVRSSLTGAFGGALQNSAQTRSYPFSFSIAAANTWEYKTITIAGDTTGTWLTTTGVGLRLTINLGAGTGRTGTANAWAASELYAPTGATSVVGTSGATFYITGVQLEPGSTATPFERRSYGQELALCQRYYWKTYNIGTVPGSSAVYAGTGAFMLAPDATTSNCHRHFPFGFLMRATPTIVGYNPNNGNTSNPIFNSGPNTNIGWNPFNVNERSFGFHMTSSVNATSTCYVHFTCSAEL